MTSSHADSDARAQLAELVRGFAGCLRRAQRRGGRWIPASSSRFASGVEGAQAAVVHDRDDDGPPIQTESEATASLEVVREQWGECTRCPLHARRTHLVFGAGNPAADVLFVGEAPGADEDRQGQPFVGRAGQLLTRMIAAMGLTRDEVYITNILKCRPPRNRDPEPDEVAACSGVLRRQIAAISPRLIITMGNFATRTLLRTEAGISSLRGRFHSYQGIAVMPTYHPSYLLRNPDAKRAVWEDLQAVMAEMDRLGLARRRSAG